MRKGDNKNENQMEQCVCNNSYLGIYSDSVGVHASCFSFADHSLYYLERTTPIVMGGDESSKQGMFSIPGVWNIGPPMRGLL